MRKIFSILASAAILTGSWMATTEACTSYIVGKNASADGSAFFGRTDDAGRIVGTGLIAVPAKSSKGTWKYTDANTGLEVELPAANYQYFMTKNFATMRTGDWGEAGGNEKGVFISATETLNPNKAALASDPYVKNGLAESNIPHLVLPYVKSAREGVERLAKLVEQYGSAESNGVIFGDKNEIWYIEIYTGHQWAAVRCPDDSYAIIGNDAIIGEIDINDTANYMASKTLMSLPESQGFLKKVNGKFHAAATYNNDLRDYSQIRVWAGRKMFSKNQTGDYDVNYRYSIFAKPDSGIKLGDLMDYTRCRFEGTPYSCDIPENNYRPVGIERTATTHVFQLREDKPVISWVSLANPEFSVFTPVYEKITSFPSEYANISKEYTPESPFWMYRTVSALATLDREKYGQDVRAAYKQLETKWINSIPEMDARYAKAGQKSVIANQLFKEISAEALQVASNLQTKLLTQISADQVAKSKKFGFDLD